MAMARGSVFISYRRQLSWRLAQLVCNDLIKHRFNTFMDLKNLDSGEFPQAILSQIETREHFVVLLEPGSLDRIGDDGDWLRREIAHALAHDRNVVPVTADGFKFGRDLVLPPDLARLPSFTALRIPKEQEYFEGAMEQLRTRFLKRPSKPTRPPAGAPVLPAPHLTGRHGNPLQVQLTWTEVSGAYEYVLERVSEYVLERARENYRGEQNLFKEVYRGPDRSYNEIPGGSTGLGRWHYRVRAASASGQAGKWSDTLSLTAGF
jgi:hypothetical protein